MQISGANNSNFAFNNATPKVPGISDAQKEIIDILVTPTEDQVLAEIATKMVKKTNEMQGSILDLLV